MAKKEAKGKLDAETMREITNFIIDRLREEEVSAVRVRHDRKRANTKVLLRNYRSLLDHCESAIYEAAHMEEEEGLAEILEMMSVNRLESFRIESIKESAVRTKLIIDHINEMLELYRLYCDRSPRPEDGRRYRVIHAMYISDTPKTTEDIAEGESVDRSTVYRDVDAAVERLTALIFGIDGLYLLKR